MRKAARVIACLLTVVAGVSGCQVAEDAAIASLRSKFLLTAEPGPAMSFVDAKRNAAAQSEIILVGGVGGNDYEPFVNGKAAFFMSELVAGAHEHEHGHGHSADDCPFCKHRAAQAAWVLVRFVDDNGKLITLDARQLFRLNIGDIVVVRGRGELNEAVDLFSITANGIHIRR